MGTIGWRRQKVRARGACSCMHAHDGALSCGTRRALLVPIPVSHALCPRVPSGPVPHGHVLYRHVDHRKRKGRFADRRTGVWHQMEMGRRFSRHELSRRWQVLHTMGRWNLGRRQLRSGCRWRRQSGGRAGGWREAVHGLPLCRLCQRELQPAASRRLHDEMPSLGAPT